MDRTPAAHPTGRMVQVAHAACTASLLHDVSLLILSLLPDSHWHIICFV